MEIPSENHGNCGMNKTLKIIGAKWTALILHQILLGVNRFGQLQSSLPGISPKTLSVRLRELEEENIVHKKVFAEVPLHVEYRLTKKGESLGEVLEKMSQWGATS